MEILKRSCVAYVGRALVAKSAIIHTYIPTACTSQHRLQIVSTTTSILINARILKPTKNQKP
jgi:hypothetical protein